MTTSCCSIAARKYCVFGCSTFLCLFALIFGLLWPTLYLRILYGQLELRNGTLVYDKWIETPIPMYIDFYLFNWTNADEVLANPQTVKPRFEECGPYVFSEHHKRVGVVWHPENGTVSFNQTRQWHFVPEQSHGSLDDVVTNVNVISAVSHHRIRRLVRR